MHRPAPRPSTRRRAAAVTILAGIALSLAGCSTQSPTQTDEAYLPSDGVGARLGSVEARSLVVVASAKGAPGVLTGSLINTGNDAVTVTFLTSDQVQSGATTGATMQLKAREQVQVSGVQFANLATPPGALASIVLQSQSAGQATVQVPVLLPGGYYSTITPTTGATTGATTGSATTSATGAATATGTATTSPATTPATTATATTPSATPTATATSTSAG